MSLKHSFMFLLFSLLAAAPAPGGEQPAPADETAMAVLAENAAAELLPIMTRWEPDKVRELGRRLASLPDPVASAALWMMTAAPRRIDTSQFYAMALSSPSPVIRRQATDILAADGSADSMRLLKSLLIGERDGETITSIIAAMARQPERRAVPTLISIMLDSMTPPRLSGEVAKQLRRLTRTNLPDSPTAWRDWWLDHSQAYE